MLKYYDLCYAEFGRYRLGLALVLNGNLNLCLYISYRWAYILFLEKTVKSKSRVPGKKSHDQRNRWLLLVLL